MPPLLPPSHHLTIKNSASITSENIEKEAENVCPLITIKSNIVSQIISGELKGHVEEDGSENESKRVDSIFSVCLYMYLFGYGFSLYVLLFFASVPFRSVPVTSILLAFQIYNSFAPRIS